MTEWSLCMNRPHRWKSCVYNNNIHSTYCISSTMAYTIAVLYRGEGCMRGMRCTMLQLCKCDG